MTEQTRIYKPKKRKLFDLLLLTNGVLFFVFVFHVFPFHLLMAVCFSANLLVIVGWYFVVIPLTQVEIVNHTLIGRTRNFSKLSIPFRKIHHIKTNTPFHGLKRKLFKDVHSTEGQVIRLQRKFLGEGQVNEIMLAIEKYPFRQGTSPSAPL